MVKPTLFYGFKCWPIKIMQVHRLMVTNMRMSRWICAYVRLDRIRNEVIREKAGMSPIQSKVRNVRRRWFGIRNDLPGYKKGRRIPKENGNENTYVFLACYCYPIIIFNECFYCYCF